uniref:Single-stranded DNA-binding protein n=1 Tax=Plectus sambesii TaxID=2011161 RepID=A0A914UHP2_9BILA
ARDPIKRTTVRGSDFVVLTVITNRYLEKADGSVLEEVEPHSCISFRPGQVDYILNNIQRGSRVFVQGALHYENVRSTRDDVQSPMVKQASIRIESIHLLKRSEGAGRRGDESERTGGKRGAVDDEEL